MILLIRHLEYQVQTAMSDCVKDSDFDRPLNTSYQERSQVSGAWLSELTGIFLQSHESFDFDNNLTFTSNM